MYAQAFDAAGALDQLEGFASCFGADFYGLPRNTAQCTLQRADWQTPTHFPFADAELKPLMGGETLPWKLMPA